MKDVNFWISLYALGAAVAAMIVVYDLRKIQEKGYVLTSETGKRIAILLLLSWVFVFFRFSVWFMDYKVWRNRKRNNNIK